MRDKNQAQRYILIDLLRGFGILLMIVFHGAFDLHFFRTARDLLNLFNIPDSICIKYTNSNGKHKYTGDVFPYIAQLNGNG